MKRILCKIGLHCYHFTDKRYKLRKNKSLCNLDDDFIHNGGFIEYLVAEKCCRCGKITYRYCQDYDCSRAIHYPTWEEKTK